MTHPYLNRGQQWVCALRKLMLYPDFEPSRHSTAFCFSGERGLAGGAHLTQIAADMGKDLLNIGFTSLQALEPHLVSVASVKVV